MDHHTFTDHVALLMREHGVTQDKARFMAWLEGPRLRHLTATTETAKQTTRNKE